MGYFTCVNCACRYYDKRFAWETDITAHCETGSNPQSADSIDRSSSAEDISTDKIGSDPRNRIDQARTRADVARMTGTIANWTGMAVPAAAPCLGSVSAVGGLVGASCGAAQLHQGLSMPSGINDPHLVTKGGVTSAVGGTCMMLGAAASYAPTLFFAAAGLGLAGLGAATAADAYMDGLCVTCRGTESDPGKMVRRSSKELTSAGEASTRYSFWDIIPPEMFAEFEDLPSGQASRNPYAVLPEY